MVRRFLALFVLVLALLAVAQPADAGVTGLPFATLFDSVVDAHGHLFVSGGSGTPALPVFDAEGSLITTLPIPGASGMVVVGDELYVSAADGPNIAVVDTAVTPPTIERTIAIAPLTQPGDLAFAGGKLWVFVTKVSTTGAGSVLVLVGFDPDGSSRTRVVQAYAINPRFVEGQAPDPEIIWFDAGVSSSPLVRFDVSSGTPRGRYEMQTIGGQASAIGEAAFSPDGRTIIAGAGQMVELRTRDLALLRRYPDDVASRVVDVAASGDIVSSRSSSRDLVNVETVSIVRANEHDASWNFSVKYEYENMLARGLRWSPDQSRLYAVMQRSEDPSGSLVLVVLHPADGSLDQDLAYVTPSIPPPGGQRPPQRGATTGSSEEGTFPLALLIGVNAAWILIGAGLLVARKRQRRRGRAATELQPEGPRPLTHLPHRPDQPATR
jgi:hypothetical protein